MSRTYRANILVIRELGGSSKRYANKRVRSTSNVDNGGNYKKHYNSYNIVDTKIIKSYRKTRHWDKTS